jgi:hypothetical protein
VDPQYWSVENGVIKGSSDTALPRNTFIWSKTPVEDFYLSVDVKLELDNRNAGIQFRSVKHGGHEALGYQADVGQDVWGRLYHDSRAWGDRNYLILAWGDLYLGLGFVN